MRRRRAEFDRSGSRVEPGRREPLKIHEEEALHDSVVESSAHKMGVQVWAANATLAASTSGREATMFRPLASMKKWCASIFRIRKPKTGGSIS